MQPIRHHLPLDSRCAVCHEHGHTWAEPLVPQTRTPLNLVSYRMQNPAQIRAHEIVRERIAPKPNKHPDISSECSKVDVVQVLRTIPIKCRVRPTTAGKPCQDLQTISCCRRKLPPPPQPPRPPAQPLLGSVGAPRAAPTRSPGSCFCCCCVWTDSPATPSEAPVDRLADTDLPRARKLLAPARPSPRRPPPLVSLALRMGAGFPTHLQADGVPECGNCDPNVAGQAWRLTMVHR